MSLKIAAHHPLSAQGFPPPLAPLTSSNQTTYYFYLTQNTSTHIPRAFERVGERFKHTQPPTAFWDRTTAPYLVFSPHFIFTSHSNPAVKCMSKKKRAGGGGHRERQINPKKGPTL